MRCCSDFKKSINWKNCEKSRFTETDFLVYRAGLEK